MCILACSLCVLVCVGDGGPVLSSQQLASELGRQRKLYDDLLTKTEHIQSVCLFFVFLCVHVWCVLHIHVHVHE